MDSRRQLIAELTELADWEDSVKAKSVELLRLLDNKKELEQRRRNLDEQIAQAGIDIRQAQHDIELEKSNSEARFANIRLKREKALANTQPTNDQKPIVNNVDDASQPPDALLNALSHSALDCVFGPQ